MCVNKIISYRKRSQGIRILPNNFLIRILNRQTFHLYKGQKPQIESLFENIALSYGHTCNNNNNCISLSFSFFLSFFYLLKFIFPNDDILLPSNTSLFFRDLDDKVEVNQATLISVL